MDIKKDWELIISSLIKVLEEGASNPTLLRILRTSKKTLEVISYDNWNGGTYSYGVTLELDPRDYSICSGNVEEHEKEILKHLKSFTREAENESIDEVIIRPVFRMYVDWNLIAGEASRKTVTDLIDKQKETLIAVATGGPLIKDVNTTYMKDYSRLKSLLSKLGLGYENGFSDLWQWHDFWKEHNLSSYKAREQHIMQMFEDLEGVINDPYSEGPDVTDTYTGWERVDRSISQMRQILYVATSIEQYQTVGMLGRETLISIAQNVYEPSIHKTEDSIVPSKTDAKAMLEAFINHVKPSDGNEEIRKYIKSAIALAHFVTHHRSATREEAETCFIAVSSIAKITRLISKV